MNRRTYEEHLDDLRHEWRSNPTRRLGIEYRADVLIRERDLAPLIAVHEAGHGVVAHALGYGVACVSRVASTVCGDGHVRIAADDLPRLHRSPRHDALITAGGAALAGMAGLPDPERGCERDRQYVEGLEHDWDESVAAGRDLLRDGWEQVAKLVVCALRTRPRLDADAFARVVAGGSAPR